MLEHPGPCVGVLLKRATRARERAKRAAESTTRDFREGVEASWPQMPANAAFVERVEQFLRARDRAVPATNEPANEESQPHVG
jgi:hypothetical protein